MPLSEHEQRLLEQMERALQAEDPKFASSLRGADPRTHHRRRVLKASVGFLAGIALLLTGVIVDGLLLVSVLGFLVMLASAFFALSSLRQIPGPGDLTVPGSATASGPAPRARRAKQRSGSGSFMGRLEERWNKRRDEGGR
ncbi:DUF3040 domain-containing protein [Vallicoccus soli]|uniref:DUF3040 domain-containing protein n=1 Tax=Vallicoccus soli TaxID=2339232 RepID=A0A3A3Z2C0_9ACTN|nr:DUF3040 domain-containing protein [Vallicoccus soli]RJK96829.1 DUF3040 domain-containing protein [Vallicoccus soli]